MERRSVDRDRTVRHREKMTGRRGDMDVWLEWRHYKSRNGRNCWKMPEPRGGTKASPEAARGRGSLALDSQPPEARQFTAVLGTPTLCLLSRCGSLGEL